MSTELKGFTISSDTRNLILQLAGSQAFAAAQVLKGRDVDAGGLDDLLGAIFQTGGEVALRYSQNVSVDVDDNLVVLRDALNSYLAQRGKINTTPTV
jgi:hypothetical protein